MKIFKLSYTIISLWKQHRYEDSIAAYIGKSLPSTPSMELGTIYDKKWSEFVDKTNRLPDELGGNKLENPRTQIKYQMRIPFSEEYEILLRGIPDIVDDEYIIDTKCGRTDASSYVDRLQLDYYSLFLPDRTVGKYICFNPYRNTHTVGIKFLSQESREVALEEIVTYGGEILSYLLINKLFVDYKK